MDQLFTLLHSSSSVLCIGSCPLCKFKFSQQKYRKCFSLEYAMGLNYRNQ